MEDSESEAPKPIKGSSWFSKIPFSRRLGYRSVNSSKEKDVGEAAGDEPKDVESPGSRTSFTDTTVVGDPPAYSKEYHGKTLADVAGAKAEVEHSRFEHDHASLGQTNYPQSQSAHDPEDGRWHPITRTNP